MYDVHVCVFLWVKVRRQSCVLFLLPCLWETLFVVHNIPKVWWSGNVQGLFCPLFFPSIYRSMDITEFATNGWLYMASGYGNLGSHAYLSTALPSESSFKPHNMFYLARQELYICQKIDNNFSHLFNHGKYKFNIFWDKVYQHEAEMIKSN